MRGDPLATIAGRAVGERLLPAAATPEESREVLEKARRHGVRLVGDGLPTITDYIAWCHAVNFQFTFLCTGDFGAGKTTLAAWLAYYVYGRGRPGPEGWAEAEKYFVYNIEDVDRLREEAARRGRLPLLIVDDAPLQLNSREFNSPAQRLFMRSYQTIREYANTVIFIANNPDEIDVSIRKKANGVIFVLSPLVMMRYPRLRALVSRARAVRAAWFCLLMRLPSYEDPTRSYRYYVPIHGPDRPFIYAPLPPDVEERLRRKKMLATERVDRMRNVLAVRKPKGFRELNNTLSSIEKRVLKALVAAEGRPLAPRELASLLGLPEKAVYQALLTLHSVTPALAVESRAGWEPSASGCAFVEQLREIEEREARSVERDLEWDA